LSIIMSAHGLKRTLVRLLSRPAAVRRANVMEECDAKCLMVSAALILTAELGSLRSSTV
jgi:hypothetical protein